jgi:hypothetical protein
VTCWLRQCLVFMHNNKVSLSPAFVSHSPSLSSLLPLRHRLNLSGAVFVARLVFQFDSLHAINLKSPGLGGVPRAVCGRGWSEVSLPPTSALVSPDPLPLDPLSLLSRSGLPFGAPALSSLPTSWLMLSHMSQHQCGCASPPCACSFNSISFVAVP